MLLILTHEAARTLRSLVLILPIIPILFAITIAADQFETSRAHAEGISRRPSYGMSPHLGGRLAAQSCDPLSKADHSNHEKGALMLSKHFPRSTGGLQYQSPFLAKRGIIPNLAISITDLTVVFNASALTSYIYTQFYENMALLWANRKQWVSTFSGITSYFLRASWGFEACLSNIGSQNPPLTHILKLMDKC